jgi:hypothetical protein
MDAGLVRPAEEVKGMSMDTDEDRDEIGIGHNRPSLADRIFAEPDATVTTVLEAVRDRIRAEAAGSIADTSARAKSLSGNAKRLPKALDDETFGRALDLLAEIGIQVERAGEVKTETVAAAKGVTDALTADCKPLDAGMAPLEKSLRPLVEGYLRERLDRHNATLPDGHEPMTSLTLRGASGARAAITVGTENVVVDATLLPREVCSPDQNLIDAEIERTGMVPGVEVRPKTSLKVYK